MKNKTKKSRSFKSGLVVLVIILAVIIGALVYTLAGSRPALSDGFSVSYSTYPGISGRTGGISVSKSDGKVKSKSYIATVYLEGTIENANSSYNQGWLLGTIENLAKDKNNVAMILYIDSPGGGVYQADEVYFALQDYKQQGKTLYAYMGPTAASGGYYVACAADKIYANRNTITGSIGVIAGQFIDATELIERLGIRTHTVHSGKNKLMGHYTVPYTEEQLQIMQELCDECYNQFVSIVVKSRLMTKSKVLELADGRVYTAAQALDNGLIDTVCSWENMTDELDEELFEQGIYETRKKTFRYEYKPTFVQSIMGAASRLQSQKAAAAMGIPEKLLEELDGFDSYPAYLWQK